MSVRLSVRVLDDSAKVPGGTSVSLKRCQNETRERRAQVDTAYTVKSVVLTRNICPKKVRPERTRNRGVQRSQSF